MLYYEGTAYAVSFKFYLRKEKIFMKNFCKGYMCGAIIGVVCGIGMGLGIAGVMMRKAGVR